MPGLKLDIGADSTGLKRGVAEATRIVGRMGAAMQVAFGMGLHSILSRTIGLIKQIAVSALKVGSSFEMLGIQFEALIGNTAKAKKLMAELREFSVKTKFTPRDVFKSGKLLLTQFSSNHILKELKMIGEISAVTGKDLEELTMIYIKAAERGKVNARILDQFAASGIGISGALAKIKNVAPNTIRSLSEMGQISFTDLRDAMQLLAKEMNGLERSSQTIPGRWSTLIGVLEDFYNTVVKMNRDKILNIIDSLINMLSSERAAAAAKFFGVLAEGAQKAGDGIRGLWAASKFLQGVQMKALGFKEFGQRGMDEARADMNRLLDEVEDRRRPGEKQFEDKIKREVDRFPVNSGLGSSSSSRGSIGSGDNAGIYLSGIASTIAMTQIQERQLYELQKINEKLAMNEDQYRAMGRRNTVSPQSTIRNGAGR